MAETKRKRGRPSKYSKAIAQEITDRLSAGEPLAQICRDDHMPAWRTVYDWEHSQEGFSADIARAREHGYDVIACRLRDTARGDGDSKDDVQRDKLIVETDLKLLAKWSKRYGDRTHHELTGANGGPVEQHTTLDASGLSDAALAEVMAARNGSGS